MMLTYLRKIIRTKKTFENVLDEGLDVLEKVTDEHVDISGKVLMKFRWYIC